MKNLKIFTLLFLSIFMLSCSDDDDDGNNNPVAAEGTIEAVINGDTFANYNFTSAVYQITENNGTLEIGASDTSGEMLTLFLNTTGGFDAGTVKEIGNTDANNFRTYVLIRQTQPQLSYNASSGSITITENRSHPTNAGQRLISGTFTVDAASSTTTDTVSMTGSFSDLEY